MERRKYTASFWPKCQIKIATLWKRCDAYVLVCFWAAGIRRYLYMLSAQENLFSMYYKDITKSLHRIRISSHRSPSATNGTQDSFWNILDIRRVYMTFINQNERMVIIITDRECDFKSDSKCIAAKLRNYILQWKNK